MPEPEVPDALRDELRAAWHRYVDLTAPLRADPAKNTALMAQTPMHRWGKPEEIASLALYICSEAAGFMTGNDVLMDGGWCAQ